MQEFTAIDFETVPSEHGPLAAEFALVVFNEAGQIKHYYEVASPVNELYANSPSCRESIQSSWLDIAPHLQNKKIIGHNIGYDKAILQKCFPELQVEKYIDSLNISRQCYPKIFNDYSLTALIESFGLDKQLSAIKLNEHFAPHRALYDSIACALLSLHLMKQEKGKEYFFPAQQNLF